MYDFIAVGDTVIDAFIKLSNVGVKTEDNMLCLSFGDKIPYESMEEIPAVGNSANAAVSASRLGLKSALVTDLGSDDRAERCLQSLEKDGVNTSFVTKHEGKRINYHYVLWYKEDRTILVNHQQYDRKFPALGGSTAKWLYLSSLGGDTLEYHHEIARYLNEHPETNFAFQPGTFQISLGTQELGDLYKRAKIFFCNVEEAGKILGIETLGIGELLKRIRALGPEIVVITDGPRGGYAYDGEHTYQQLPYPDIKPPLERTGAGDAFASTTVCALALGKDLSTALEWGAINSMSVVQQVGAQKGLLSKEKIEEYLKSAPAEFKTKKLD